MAHKVCVFICPVCDHQKVLNTVNKRCHIDLRCKNCDSVSNAQKYQECFGFRGVTPMNQ